MDLLCLTLSSMQHFQILLFQFHMQNQSLFILLTRELTEHYLHQTHQHSILLTLLRYPTHQLGVWINLHCQYRDHHQGHWDRIYFLHIHNFCFFFFFSHVQKIDWLNYYWSKGFSSNQLNI